MDKPLRQVQDKPWYAPRRPEEMEAYPWLHPTAVEYLGELLRPNWRVLEHGAGGSTLWFADRAAKVVSIEHTLQWREEVRRVAPANVTLLESLPEAGQIYNLFLIDGEREMRGRCINAAPLLVKPGGWVVLDNANRPEYADERDGLRAHAKLVARFDNNIPRSLYFVTEFWQCASE